MTADRNCLARWKGCLQSLNEGTLFLPRLDCLFEEDGVDAQVQQLMTRCFRRRRETWRDKIPSKSATPSSVRQTSTS